MSDMANELKILIVEDQLSARQMLSTALRTKNIPLIDIAVDGQIGRDMIEQAHAEGTPYHIVFLDWDMPKITGIELLKHFRGRSEYAKTAFVMVTSMSLQAQVLDAIRSGATAYMIKPVSPVSVAARFNEIMGWLKQKQSAAFT
jgi:two-component system chemotaxis response regulator CheY